MAQTIHPDNPALKTTVGGRPPRRLSARWPLAILAAAIVTVALFVLMQRLIVADVISLAEPEAAPRITINFQVEPVDPVRQTMGIDQVEVVAPPPPTPRIDARAEGPVDGVVAAQYDPPTLNRTELLGALPIAVPPPPMTIRTNPVYPARELGRGVEGNCMVSYDILASGVTANIKVVRCDSAGFARATIAAVERWRHAADTTRAPGAVVRRGMVAELNYRLEE